MEEKLLWKGATGYTYQYSVYPTSDVTPPDEDGNYIFCRAEYLTNNQIKYNAIYIGQGNLKDRVGDNHHKIDCIREKNPTHVCLRINTNDSDRKAEEEDLLNMHNEAFPPTGCNEQKS